MGHRRACRIVADGPARAGLPMRRRGLEPPPGVIRTRPSTSWCGRALCPWRAVTSIAPYGVDDVDPLDRAEVATDVAAGAAAGPCTRKPRAQVHTGRWPHARVERNMPLVSSGDFMRPDRNPPMTDAAPRSVRRRFGSEAACRLTLRLSSRRPGWSRFRSRRFRSRGHPRVGDAPKAWQTRRNPRGCR